MKIITGNANPKLAQEIAEHCFATLVPATVSTFADSESSVEFNENEIFSYTDAAGVTHSVDFHKANNAPDYNQGKQAINAIINKYSKVSDIFTKAENAEI